MASLTISSLYSITYVWIGCLSLGASSRTLISRIPTRLICKVLGIGVAVNVSTSTVSLTCLIFSLWRTPKRCSSSTIRSPRSLYFTSEDNRRCVPITISTSPFFKSSSVFFCSPAVRNLDSISTRTGKSFILCTKVL